MTGLACVAAEQPLAARRIRLTPELHIRMQLPSGSFCWSHVSAAISFALPFSPMGVFAFGIEQYEVLNGMIGPL